MVDDEVIIADTVTTIMRQHGHDAHTAYCAERALEWCRDQQPDAVLTDVIMGPMKASNSPSTSRTPYLIARCSSSPTTSWRHGCGGEWAWILCLQPTPTNEYWSRTWLERMLFTLGHERTQGMSYEPWELIRVA